MGTRAMPSPRPEGSGAARVLARMRPAVLAAGLTLLAAPYVGIVWEKISPAPTYVNLSGEVYLDNQDSSEFIAADGWFLIIGLLLGIVSAAVAYWRWRGDLGVIAAMSGASVLASLIAREVGEAFGPAPIQQTALTLADGETIHGSITLASDGILFAWAVGILLTYLSLIGGLERSRGDEDPESAAEHPWQDSQLDAVDHMASNGAADGHGPSGDASVGTAGLAGDVGTGQ